MNKKYSSPEILVLTFNKQCNVITGSGTGSDTIDVSVGGNFEGGEIWG